MAEPTIDDILRGAKKFLSERHVVDDANDFAANQRHNREVENRGPETTYAGVAKDTALGAALPASLLAGPVGIGAGALLSMEGAGKAVRNPTAANIGMAGLGLLPFMGPLRRLLSGGGKLAGTAAKELQVLNGADDVGRAAMFDDVLARQPKAEPPTGTMFDMTGNARTKLPTTNTSMPDTLDTGRLAGRGANTDDTIEDALFGLADESPEAGALQSLDRLIERRVPAPSPAGAFSRQSPASFRTQVPEVLESQAADVAGAPLGSVAADGFDLGQIVDAPMSRQKQAAQAMEALQRQTGGRGWLGRQPETHADWAQVDAVPFPQAKTLRPDESMIGLARELDPRVLSLKGAPSPSGKDELARALRQRARIGQHYGPQEALAALER